MQKLLLDEQLEKMLANGRADAAAIAKDGNTADVKPVVKLFCPWGAATWLLTALDEDGDRAFGLADLGMQSPELGYVSLEEIRSIRGPGGLRIERDIHFTATKTLSKYAREARAEGRIMA
jgi:hypothetical protein